ncbi:MAG: hypothetical protein NVS4B12_04500 [Ktedonobacteraceae bacterium]
MQIQQTQASLYRARLLLEEGRSEAARTVLEAIQTDTDTQQRDVSYLLGWYYIISSQWKNATQTLSPLLATIPTDDENTSQETLLDREHFVIHLLRLGQTAVNLVHYEDASRHFALCLKILHDRRIHLPSIRIEAQYNLAMTYVMRGSYAVAIHHYNDSLRLCRLYELNEALPNIYYGLSEAYRFLGDFTKAYEAAHEALRLCQIRGDELLQCRMYNVLGHISLSLGDYVASANYYIKSLSLAENNNKPKMKLLNCVALADLFLEKEHMSEAKAYVHQALDATAQVDDPFICGLVYASIGIVTLAEARMKSGSEGQRLFNDAISWLQKSATHFQSAQASKGLAQTYVYLATASEEVGRSNDALSYWKLAYTEAEKARKTLYISLREFAMLA